LNIRPLELDDMDAAARVHRISFDHALPWLTGLHTPEQDPWFYRERVFTGCQVHGAFEGGALAAIIAFRREWIEQLYVLPEVQGCGVGSELLQIAKRAFDCLQLWTFQRNLSARRFYEARGFALVEETDGARNEEKEPDVRYFWTRASVP
jgi:GNAT superfamily N-acetyltransferase